MFEKYKYEIIIFAVCAVTLVAWDSIASHPHDWGERIFALAIILIAITAGSLKYRMSQDK